MVRANWTLDVPVTCVQNAWKTSILQFRNPETDIAKEECSGVGMDADIEHMANLEDKKKLQDCHEETNEDIMERLMEPQIKPADSEDDLAD